MKRGQGGLRVLKYNLSFIFFLRLLLSVGFFSFFFLFFPFYFFFLTTSWLPVIRSKNVFLSLHQISVN